MELSFNMTTVEIFQNIQYGNIDRDQVCDADMTPEQMFVDI